MREALFCLKYSLTNTAIRP